MSAKLKKSASTSRGKSCKDVVASTNRNTLASLFQKQQSRWDAMFAGTPPEHNSQSDSASKDSSISDECSSMNLSETSSSSNHVLEQTTISNENVYQNSVFNAEVMDSTNGVADKIRVVNFLPGDKEKVEESCVVQSKLSLKRVSSTSPSESSIKRCSSTSAELQCAIFVDSSKFNSDISQNDVKSEKLPYETVLGDDERENVEIKLVPYYLENFLTIINDVVADEFYSDLFNEEDHKIFDVFLNFIDEKAQKLYVRLFLRKLKWLTKNKIEYKQIADDLTPALDQLTNSGLLMNETQMNDIEEVVHCMSAPNLRNIAKTLHLAPNLSRPALVDTIVAHGRRKDIGHFFSQATGGTEKIIIKRCKVLLGSCYKLNEDVRCVFARCMMLYGLHNTVGDDDNVDQQQQLYQMLLNKIGQLKYPDYTVQRSTKVFPDRESLIRYSKALQFESRLFHVMEKKDYNAAFKIYSEVKVLAEQLLADQTVVQYDSKLPDYLRQFTACSVFVRLFTRGVEVLQFLKLYEDAVNQLRYLLAQSVYHPNRRGLWYDRLALNLDYHLKEPMHAIDVIKAALNDGTVRTGRRYSLLLRAKKICNSSVVKKLNKSLWCDFMDDPMNSVQEAPNVTILGKQLTHAVPGTTPLYVTNESYQREGEDVTVFTRVEDVALRHYADNGYPEGIHGEVTTLRTLFTLFMWDILFMSGIDDVFYNKYQAFPLDLLSDDFYLNRRQAITDRLQRISEYSTEELCAEVDQTWIAHADVQCAAVAGETFRDSQHVQGLVACFGGRALSGIFDRMARMMRQVTGGVPDLIVWNPDTQKCKVVEVKGPGDRLSTKQILWLDYLLGLGVDAEVCHVKAVGSKKLKMTSSESKDCCLDDT